MLYGYRILISLTALFCTSPCLLYGQDLRTDTVTTVAAEWVSAGFGVPHFGMNYSFSFGKRYYSASLMYKGPFIGGFHLPYAATENEYFYGLAGSVGARKAGRYYLVSFFVGPSFYIGAVDSKYVRPGLLGTGQAFVKPIKDLGLGLEVLAALNPADLFAGIRLSVTITNGR